MWEMETNKVKWYDFDSYNNTTARMVGINNTDFMTEKIKNKK